MTAARKEYLRQWRERNRESIRAKAAEYRAANRERINRHMRRYAEANVDKVRNYQLVRRYGIDQTDYARMSAEQRHRCLICTVKAEDARNARLYVDHCHATKKVRGLLCSQCNRALGMFGDDPQRIANALRYLGGGE